MSNNCYFVAVLFCAIQWDRSTSSTLLCQGAILSFPPARPTACVLPTLPFNATSANKHVFLKLGESGLKHVNCQCMNAALTSPPYCSYCTHAFTMRSINWLVSWGDRTMARCNERNGSPGPCIILAFNSGPKNIGITELLPSEHVSIINM